MKNDPFQIPTSAELRDGLRGDITKLTAEVARLTAELQGERDDLANARKWIDGQDVRSDFPNVTQMRQALDRERERCGVLEREVKAWNKWADSEYTLTVGVDNVDAYAEVMAARKATDTRHALDAAKFVGGGQ